MNSIIYVVVWLLTLSLSNASAFSSMSSIHVPSSLLSKSALLVRGGERVPESILSEPNTPVEMPTLVRRSPPTLVNQIPSRALAVPTTFAMIGSVFTAVGRFYTRQLDEYPLFTRSYTAGIIFALSDYVAQKLENGSGRDKSIEKKRLLAATLLGSLYFGPAAHYWYEAIFAWLPGTSRWSTLQKAILGLMVFGLSFTRIFFAVSLLQAGQFSLVAWGQKIRSDLPVAWLAEAGFWPLVDLISFSIVPMKWIPLFINLCSLVWTISLSLVANRNTTTSSKESAN